MPIAQAERPRTKTATFDFLGFTHRAAPSRDGKFTVHVSTMKKRLRRALKAIADWCREHRHDPVDDQQRMLNAKLRGHYQYYGRPTNYHGSGSSIRARPPYLAQVAQPPDAGKALPWATLRATPLPPSASALPVSCMPGPAR